MIKANIQKILSDIPASVMVVAAAKTRTPEDITEAIEAGITAIGENYVQEAERAYLQIGSKANWHLIGHLQTNKARKAARIFDMVQTVDTLKLASAINQACKEAGKRMPILIEVNSGEEAQKAGAMPGDLFKLINDIAALPNVKISGLMTMGPLSDKPEDSRPFFRITRRLYEEVDRSGIDNVEMEFLSMGMSDSYRVAIDEGANMVRLGTCIFGERISPR